MSVANPGGPPRLVDLAVEWPLQYAGESTDIDAGAYPGVRDRLGQVEGYLSETAIALVWSGPAPVDRTDPWAEVAGLMARVEAEFAGRILIESSDLDRLDAEPPDTLTWAVVGLRGAASLLRSGADVDRLASLIDRGVRAVRLANLVDRPPGPEGDSDLGGAGRSAIAAIASASRSVVMVDLAGLAPRAAGEAIAAIEATGGRLLPIVSVGGSLDGKIAGLRPEDFRRLRSLGGVVGLGVSRTFHPDIDALGRSIESTADREAIGLGTGFLGIEEPIEGLGTAAEILVWLAQRFDPDTAGRLAAGNVRGFIERIVRGA